MLIRQHYLKKDEPFTAAQTLAIDINIKKPITRIDILIEMKNGSAMTESSVVKPHDEFTKISLVNGSDVLDEGSMEQYQGLNFVEMGKAPLMNLTLHDALVQGEMCYLNYGYFLGDPNHYLDPGKFGNLQLRITNTFTTAAVDAWHSSGHSITVIAHVIEEGVSDYQGFLRLWTPKSYDAVDGTIVETDLPNDFPIRLLSIQALKTGADVTGSLELIKLALNADSFVFFDGDVDHLVMQNVQDFGLITQKLDKRMTGAGDIFSDLYYKNEASPSSKVASQFLVVVAIAGEKVSVEENKIATS